MDPSCTGCTPAGGTATQFNAGHGSGGRWSFFGHPPVPVLYAADTELAAVAETILHDVPVHGGRVARMSWEGRVISRLRTTRQLKLARLHGLGLRAVGVHACQLTDTPAAEYPTTRVWAEALHALAAQFDGLSWMSRQCNSDRAVVLFGDRVAPGDLDQDAGHARFFSLGSPDLDWLINQCGAIGIEVEVPL